MLLPGGKRCSGLWPTTRPSSGIHQLILNFDENEQGVGSGDMFSVSKWRVDLLRSQQCARAVHIANGRAH